MPQPILILLDYIEKIILDLNNGIKRRSLIKTTVAYGKLTELSNQLKELLPKDFREENFKDFDRHMHFIGVFLRKQDFGWIRSNFDDIRKEDFPKIKKKIYALSKNEKPPTKLIGKKKNLSKLTTDLMGSASFLGLDTNWSLATCALQLQEIAVTLVAEKKKIKLDKTNVEKILNKKIKELSFNDQYEAFTKQVKDSYNIEMPILLSLLRKMRVKVLHEGYNPKPEETESIASFTIGLLEKLKDLS